MKISCVLAFIACIYLTILAKADTKEIEVISGNYPPFLGADLEKEGISSDYFRTVLESHGYKVKFGYYPWPRAYQMIKNGEGLLSIFWTKTPDRLANVNFSKKPITANRVAIFYKKAKFPKGIKFESFEDLKNIELAGVQSYWYLEDLDKNGIKYQPVNNSEQAWSRLQHDRVDAIVDSEPVGLHEMELYYHADLKGVEKRRMKKMINEAFFIYPKKLNAENKRLIQEIEAIFEEAYLKGLFEKHFQVK